MLADVNLKGVRRKCGFVNGVCFSSLRISGGFGFWWDDLSVRSVQFYFRYYFFTEIFDDNG